MIDVMETIVEAKKILDHSEGKYITAEEFAELRKMGEWEKINTAFALGVIAGAKSITPENDKRLLNFLAELSSDRLKKVREYSEWLLCHGETVHEQKTE